MYRPNPKQVALGVAITALSARPALACESDVECKGDRVCIDGGCQTPTAALATPAPAPNPNPATPPAPAPIAPYGATPPAPAPIAPYRETSAARPMAPPSTLVPEDQPEGRRSLRGLWIAGAVTLPAVWAIGLGLTVSFDLGADDEIDAVTAFMAIPVVGPWIAIADPEDNLSEDPGATAGIATMGVLQAAGLTMLAVGLALDDRGEDEPPVALQIAPSDPEGRPGLSLGGRF